MQAQLQALTDETTTPDKRRLLWFQWLSNLQRDFLALSPAAALSSTATPASPAPFNWPLIEKTLIGWVTGADKLPVQPIPHPCRMMIASCLSLLYEVGETKSLYSNVNSIISLLPTTSAQLKKNAGSDDAADPLITVVYVSGVLLGQHGRKIASLVDPTVVTLYRLYKLMSNNAVRIECLRAMTKCFVHVFKLPENIVKDISKTIKTDGSFHSGQHATAFAQWVRIILVCPCAAPLQKLLSVDADNIFKLALKAAEHTSGASRTAFCYLNIALLDCMRSNPAVAVKRLIKLQEKFQDLSLDSSAAMTDKILTTLNLNFVPGQTVPDRLLPFTLLSAYLIKYHTEGRVLALLETYTVILRNKGSVVVQENYGTYFKHFLDIVTNPKFDRNNQLAQTSGASTYVDTRLITQRMCAHIVKEVIGKSLLPEAGRLDAVRFIFSSIIEPIVKEVVAVKGRVKLSRRIIDIIKFTVDEVSNLVIDLGKLSFTLSPYIDTLLSLIDGVATHRLDFFLSIGWCLRCFLLCIPHTMAENIVNMVKKVEDAVTHADSISNDYERFIGDVYILAQCISVVPYRKLQVSNDMFANVFHLASQMMHLSSRYVETIASASDDQSKATTSVFWSRASYLGHSAWVLVGSLMILGPDIVHIHLPQLLTLWKSTLAKPTKESIARFSDSEESKSGSAEHWMYVVIVREAALSAMFSLIANNTQLCSVDVSRRLIHGVMAGVNTSSMLPAWIHKISGDTSCKYEGRPLVADFSVTNFSSASIGTINSTVITPETLDLMGMCSYTNLSTHILLFKKRLFQVCEAFYTHCHHSPHLYEPVHVPLLRMSMELISGDVMSGPTTNDINRLVTLYSGEYSGGLFGTSYLRGLCPDLARLSEKQTPKYEKTRHGSFSNLSFEESAQKRAQNVPSGLRLKRQEGVGPQDSLDDGVSMMLNIAWYNGAPEHDPWLSFILLPKCNMSEWSANAEPYCMYIPRPLPAQVAVTDCAIDLFGILFGLQGAMYQEILLDQMAKSIKLHQAGVSILTANVGTGNFVIEARERAVRKGMFMYINSMMAVLSVCMWVQTGAGRKIAPILLGDTWGAASTAKMQQQESMLLHVDGRIVPLLQDISMTAFGSANSGIRFVAAETLGRLAKIVSSSSPPSNPPAPSLTGGQQISFGAKYASDLIKNLIEVALNSSRDPLMRAGACVGLATVVKYVGSIATPSSQLKTLVNILQSLAIDGNSCVHAWALYSYWIVMEVVGVNTATTMGPKEVISDISTTVLHVISGATHEPFWGSHQQILANSYSGQNAVEVHCSLIDPYRSVLRILHATLGAFGPELQFGAGASFADYSTNIVNFMRAELDEVYSPLLQPVPESAVEQTMTSLVIRNRLGFIAQSYALGGSAHVTVSSATSVSSAHCIMVECVRCMQQLATFGTIKTKDVAKPITDWIQVIMLTSSVHAVPISLHRAIVKLVWHAVVAGWSGIGGTTGFIALMSDSFVEQLMYILDVTINMEKVENGRGLAGSLDDDVSLSSSSFDPSGGGNGGSGATSLSFVENEVKEILSTLMKLDLSTANLYPNKWICLLQGLLSRTVVQTVAQKESQTNEGGALVTTEAAKESAEDDDKASDDGDEGGGDDAGDAEEPGFDDDGDGGEIEDGKASKMHSNAPSPSKLDNNQLTPVMSLDHSQSASAYISLVVRQNIALTQLATWRLQVFLILCVGQVISMTEEIAKVSENARDKSHFDLKIARTVQTAIKSSIANTEDLNAFMNDSRLPLVLRLNDLIRLAFNAGTSSMAENIRVGGLELLNEIIRVFGPVVDPDFPEFSLLEQYQAQIVAGISLTMNFGSQDASPTTSVATHMLPEVQVMGNRVCAAMITSGISSDGSSLSRLVKSLDNMLNRFDGKAVEATESTVQQIVLVPHVWAVVRISVLQSWALLYTESLKTPKPLPYLRDLIQPRLNCLAIHWAATIKENDRLKVISDAQMQSSPSSGVGELSMADGLRFVTSGIVDTMYVDASKNVLAPVYLQSFRSLYHCIGLYIRHGTKSQVDELFQTNNSPGPLFYLLLGQSVEIILEWCGASAPPNNDNVIQSLKMIRSLLSDQVSGDFVGAWLESPIVDEICLIFEKAIWKENNLLLESKLVAPVLAKVVATELQLVSTIMKDTSVSVDVSAIVKLSSSLIACAIGQAVAFPVEALDVYTHMFAKCSVPQRDLVLASFLHDVLDLLSAGCAETKALVCVKAIVGNLLISQDVQTNQSLSVQLVGVATMAASLSDSLTKSLKMSSPQSIKDIAHVRNLILLQTVILTVGSELFSTADIGPLKMAYVMTISAALSCDKATEAVIPSTAVQSMKTVWIVSMNSGKALAPFVGEIAKTLFMQLKEASSASAEISKLLTAVLASSLDLQRQTGLLLIAVPLLVEITGQNRRLELVAVDTINAQLVLWMTTHTTAMKEVLSVLSNSEKGKSIKTMLELSVRSYMSGERAKPTESAPRPQDDWNAFDLIASNVPSKESSGGWVAVESAPAQIALKMDFASFNKFEYVKLFEASDSLLPNTWLVIRIDGRSFHKFSATHEFAKPNDTRALKLMNAAARGVMRDLIDITMAFGESDEYSFIVPPDCNMYQRRSSKLSSTVVSLFTGYYVSLWSEYMEGVRLKYIPSFDSRVVVYPTDKNIRDYLSWRQADTHINNLFNTCFWYLVEKADITEVEAEKRLRGTSSGQKNELLFSQFNTNYNNLPEMFRKGSFLYRKYETYDHVRGSGNTVTRTRTIIQEDYCDIIGDDFWTKNSHLMPNRN